MADAGATEATDAMRRMRLVRRAAIATVILIGWIFIAWSNHFRVSAPVVFVALGFVAVVAVVVNLWKTGAVAVAPDQAGNDAWERPIGPRDELEKEKKTLLKAIKEAEFDHEMGKLSKVDADQMIATYRARAIAVIKELERPDEAAAAAADVRAKIEAEVKARLAVEKEKGKGKKKASKAKAEAQS